MKQVPLGKSGLTVSELCLGAMSFGTAVEERAAFAMLDAFVERGGTFIDTANNYAHWAGTGDESETLLGRWLARSGKRQQVTLATKVGFDRHGVGAGLRAHQIETWCDESLRKLGVETIDLYYAHVDDPATPLEETMAAFDSLLRKGKVRAIGGSNYYTWRLCEMFDACRAHGLAPYSVLQQRYTYLFAKNGAPSRFPFNEDAATEKLRFLAQRGMPLVAYSCSARGGYADHSRLSPDYIQGERLAVLDRMAQELGIPAQRLVLAWMLNSWRFQDRPRIIPLFSSSRVETLLDNLAACDVTLGEDVWARLNEA